MLQAQSSPIQAIGVDNLGHFYNHIPRVSYQNIIISPETWFVDKKDILDIDTSDSGMFKNAVLKLSEKYGLKDMLTYGLGDNILPFALNSCHWFELLQKQVKKSNGNLVKLVEYVGFDPAFIQGQSYEQEIVIPLLNSEPVYQKYMGKECYFDQKNRYLPLDDWSTIKVYGGKKELDELIGSVLGPYILQLKNQGKIEKWFFIHYNVPSWHLRIRIKGKNKEGILVDLNSLLSKFGVGNVELSSYIRESERYGGSDHIADVEDIFDADSQFYVMSANSGKIQYTHRWRICLNFIRQLLEEVYTDESKRLSYTRLIRDGLSRRYKGLRHTRKSIGKFYHENSLSESIDTSNYISSPLDKYMSTISKMKEGTLSTSFEMILSSIIHMHVNRFLIEGGPEIEYIIYDILFRYFSSQKNKKG